MMPGMDGWAVLSALKSDPAVADIPVVMLTIVDDKNLGYALGAADYLTKPIDRTGSPPSSASIAAISPCWWWTTIPRSEASCGACSSPRASRWWRRTTAAPRWSACAR
jgi:PleD family two-component response regulator